MIDGRDQRLADIRRRAEDCLTYNFGMCSADTLAHDDVFWLLDLVQRLEAPHE